jgi:AraC-like DNA-binding protein
MVRREALESAVNAWPLIRRDPQPVAILRHALARQSHPLLPADLRLAVRDLLDHRYAEKILARDVAGMLKVSASRMNRCFRMAFGSTIHRHLLKLRVRHGLDLIARGMKIEAAALSVGFRSKKDFCRAVQQLVGCTPAQFRSRDIGRDGSDNAVWTDSLMKGTLRLGQAGGNSPIPESFRPSFHH